VLHRPLETGSSRSLATRTTPLAVIGFSSVHLARLNSGMAMYDALKEKLSHSARVLTNPRNPFSFAIQRRSYANPLPPRLYRGAISKARTLCGPPAIDREFKTSVFSPSST